MTSRQIAGAPITWGVCEVPGWGLQMTPGRVLSEMATLGITASELGPDGFLPRDPVRLRALLSEHGMSLVAGFVPAVLHDPGRWATEGSEVARQIANLAAGFASIVVLAASTGDEGYEGSAHLTDDQWSHLVSAISDVEGMAAEHNMTVAFHPHYGTVIERPREIKRLLDTSPVGLCLDSGHIMVGGGDPVAIAESAVDRIVHVHLKDVNGALAAGVRNGELGYHEAVIAGMYPILGSGDVDIPSIIRALDRAGYQGWYVLEQDTALAEEPGEGEGPFVAAAASFAYLNQEVPPRE